MEPFLGEKMNTWKINNLQDLFNCLDVTQESLDEALKINRKRFYYRDCYTIPKKNGERTICSVDKGSTLYVIQKKLKINYLDNIFLPDTAYGFVKGQSYYDFLEIHTDRYVSRYLRIDIKDFFDSINRTHINRSFDFILKDCNDKEDIKKYLRKILLYNNKLVQGTPTAPVVSNIVFRALDIRIERYCSRMNVLYSRYADDLLFSSSDNTVISDRFFYGIKAILGSEGFTINYEKVRKSKIPFVLNGLVVDDSIRLSRRKLSKIGKILYCLEHNKYKKNNNFHVWINAINDSLREAGCDASFYRKDNLIFYLSGYRSYLIQLIKNDSINENNAKKIGRIIKRLEKQLDIIQ